MFRPTLFGDKNGCWSEGYPFGHCAGFTSEWRVDMEYSYAWLMCKPSFGKPGMLIVNYDPFPEEEERPIWVPKENAMKLKMELTPEQAGDILQDLHWAARDLDNNGQELSAATSRLWELLEDLRGE